MKMKNDVVTATNANVKKKFLYWRPKRYEKTLMQLETMKFGGAAALVTTVDGVSVFCFTYCEFDKVFSPAAARRALTIKADRVRINTLAPTHAAVLASPGDGTADFDTFVLIATRCDEINKAEQQIMDVSLMMYDSGRYE